MKKIIFGIFVFLINSSIYAQSLELIANTTELDINNPLQLTISISDATQGGNIGIKNLNENFNILSRSQSQSIQIINGKRSANTQFQIQVKAKKIGKYTIGPAQIQIGTGLVESNTIQVNISGEKLFVNGQPQGWKNAATSPPIQKNISSHTEKGNNTTKIIKKNTFLSWKIFTIAFLLIFFVIRWQRKKEQEKGNEKYIEERTKDVFETSFKKKSENTINKKTILYQKETPPIQFPDIQSKNYPEKLEKWIRWFIGNKFQVDTLSMTFEELHALRASSHGKNEKEIHDAIKNNTCTLHKIFVILEHHKYGGKEIDKEKLDEMAKSWKDSIKE